MTNESALLGLLADQQKRIYALESEIGQLRQALAEATEADDTSQS